MRYLTVICMMLASFSGAVSQTMTHEETLVRTAYAKFAYASEQRVVGDLLMEKEVKAPIAKDGVGLTASQRMAAAEITFTLKDFVIGDIRDIINGKALDFISPPMEEVLTTNGEVGHDHNDGGLKTHWDCLEVQWAPGRVVPPELSNATLDDLYQLEWHKQRPATLWQRYASYSVTVTFQGKTRGPYNAFFIFGHDEKGDENIQIEDATTNGLGAAITDKLFPDAFLLTHLRNDPILINWLSTAQMNSPACAVGKDDLCCDLMQMKCGPGRADVVNALAKPLSY